MYIPLLPHLQPGRQEAGCDEAGRGPLAGPVYAAAVILPPGFSHPLLQDSKMMTERHRLEVRDFIMEKAVGWGVAWCSPEEIDRWNILRASITAMHRALDKLPVSPDYILVDGNRFYPYHPGGGDSLLSPVIPHQCLVRGDRRFAAIAAASVLAKTFRDQYMTGLDRDFPVYGWKDNKGYPTKKHREAIGKYGLTVHHRRSFSCHL
ncbi:MAG: ribonuclease HII [Bacteroidales bacterium]|jgi:ribonuclease HII|nr:ribonuclease HII [Bacteroidales bacterium]MDD2823941.1 ribonuclease HII [Bacteroidales bacterium]MDD3101231.1 ribonuclease HII [Bacteroidales bacterium]MDD3638945.1 ribonuclease HII [Bacteroidales bacterium]MDD3943817.1 ribonuclease HII [Bacteroidales bacterium]